MFSRSTSPELAKGVIAIVVGVLAVHATVLTSPEALDAAGSAIYGTGLPPNFKGLGGGATLFVVILTAVMALATLSFGLVRTLEQIFHLARYRRPRAVAFSMVGALFWASTLITVLMYDFNAAVAFLALSPAMATICVLAAMVVMERRG